MKSKESIDRVLNDASEPKANMAILIAANNDEKTRFISKDRLSSIGKKLFKKHFSDDEMFSPFTADDILPGTIEEIQATTAYKDWADDTKPATTILLVWGSSGSGKSRILDAVNENPDSTREPVNQDDPNIYVAAYILSDKRSKTTANKKSSGSSIPYALKIVALQVARQSTAYAKDLLLQLQKQEKMHFEDDIDKTWNTLRLSKFTVRRPSILYILLDAVESENLVDLGKLLALFSESQKEPGETLKIKILLAMNSSEEKVRELIQSGGLHEISAKEIGQKLIPSFVTNEMLQKGLFQDSDRETRRLKHYTLKQLTASRDTNFDKARRKLNNIRDAIENNLLRGDLQRLLEDAGSKSVEREGQEILRELERTLGSTDAALLNSILKWLTASQWRCMKLPILEAALHLENASLPIEPLTKKINHRFGRALVWRGETVCMNDSVEMYLREAWNNETDRGRTPVDEPRITLDISIKNATQLMVEQFVWNLNEHMVSGNFDFGPVKANGTIHLEVDKLSAQLEVTHLCFKLMNEGWDDDTQAMLSYAYTEFPRHLALLRDMQHLINNNERKTIGEDLIAFLADTYCFDQRHQSYGDGAWMIDLDLTSAVKFWLTDEMTLRQLPLKEQRWIQQSLDPNAGPLAFMRSQAVSIWPEMAFRLEIRVSRTVGLD